MSAEAKRKVAIKPTPFHLEPDDGLGLGVYPLIRAAYHDKLEQARDILKADPDQINTQDPYAGLSPLHIAIFRQNGEMVRLFTDSPRCDVSLKDNFQRAAADMLVYTSDPIIFDPVMRCAYPEQERQWAAASEDEKGAGTVVSFKPPRG